MFGLFNKLDYKYKGLIMGLEQLGCKHDKTDFNTCMIYFTVPKDFTQEKLERASKACSELIGFTFKYKVV